MFILVEYYLQTWYIVQAMSRSALHITKIICALLFLMSAFCMSAQIPADADFWSNYPSEELSEALIDRMTDEELLAQILMFGWAGQEPSSLLIQWVAERGLGSVKLFGWNTENLEKVANSITTVQQKSQSRRFRIPLYVATDQEGGFVRHVKGNTSITPGNLAIGAGGYAYDAYWSGYYINREIAALGINMNFAPTVDLYTNKNSTVIGTRSFGEDADNAGILGASFAAGSLAAGVIPTAKHFPGHGGTDLDSHGRLPIIDVSVATLNERELVPFKYLVDNNIPAIMSAHLAFPQIEPEGAPASLSKSMLTGILREQMGYEGLIITDDMQMNGATLYAGAESRAYELAIRAGNDILISSRCASLEAGLWTHNLDLMRSDSEFREAVKTAARRVVYTKMEYFKHSRHVELYPDVNKIAERIPDPEGQAFFLDQACRSITVFKKGTIPFKPADSGRILLMGQVQAFPEFLTEGRKRYPRAKFFGFNYNLGPNETQWVKDNLAAQLVDIDTVIICVADDRSTEIAEYLRDLGRHVIVLSIMSPVPVLGYGWAEAVLLGYSYSPYTFNALFGALAGEFEPQGKMPLYQR